MKTFLTSAAVAVALTASAGAASAQSAAPASYKAVRDFSYNNPGGVWSYGYGTAGAPATFVRYTTGLVSGANGLLDAFNESESVVAVTTQTETAVHNPGSSQVVIPVDALVMHPRSDGQETMVVFTAPAAGTYKIEGFYEILDNAPTGVRPRIVIGTKEFTRAAFNSKVDVVLTGASKPGTKEVGQKRAFTLTRQLSKGNRVQFALNPNGDWRFDSTGFSATVTLVPTP